MRGDRRDSLEREKATESRAEAKKNINLFIIIHHSLFCTSRHSSPAPAQADEDGRIYTTVHTYTDRRAREHVKHHRWHGDGRQEKKDWRGAGGERGNTRARLSLYLSLPGPGSVTGRRPRVRVCFFPDDRLRRRKARGATVRGQRKHSRSHSASDRRLAALSQAARLSVVLVERGKELLRTLLLLLVSDVVRRQRGQAAHGGGCG